MNWRLKAKAYRVLSTIPFGNLAHYQLQRHVTKELPRRPEYVGQLITATRKLVDRFQRVSSVDLGKTHFVEVGAGRDLTVPIALRLMGVGHVTSVDIDRLANLFLMRSAARHIAAQLDLPCPDFKSWSDVEAFGISYRAPAYVEEANIPTASVDSFFSVDTLEHIPVASLSQIHKEAFRMLKAGGVSMHIVDYSDHYARGTGLSRFNFLTFTDEQWAPFNGKFQYLNRLRHSEHVNLMKEAGFSIKIEEPDIEMPEELILKNLAPQFKKFTNDDLFATRGTTVAMKP